MNLLQALDSIGLLASLAGLLLIVRYGFRRHSRIEFGGTMPAAEIAGFDEIRRHNNDVKGRFGFVLVLLGVLMQAGVSWCVWLQP